ncbi:FkbM family methyltransferase [Patescibacteria group bacterium]|nr:FkbM family methyltransferase [Patescibacteria group bacterium]
MQLNNKLDFFKVFSLGNGFANKIWFFLLYIVLRVKRLIGLPTSFNTPIKIRLNFKGRSFNFYIKYILDFHLLKEIFIDEIYKHQIEGTPDVILDAGSNIGASVVYFKLLYPNSKVFAIEPHHGCIEVLHENAKDFNIEVVSAALSDHDGVDKFYFNDEHWSASLFDRGRGSKPIDVRTISLDSFLKEFNIDKVDIFKMDIEGAEFDVFKVFNQRYKINILLGELHPKITNKTINDFKLLIPDFELIDSRDEGGHINVLFKRKESL